MVDYPINKGKGGAVRIVKINILKLLIKYYNYRGFLLLKVTKFYS